MEKKNYSKGDIIVNNSNYQDKIIFLDDSLENITTTNEKGINSIHINTNNGITPCIENKVLKFFNLL